MNILFCLKLLCLFLPHCLSLGHHAKYPEVQEIVGVCIYVCMHAEEEQQLKTGGSG